MPTWYRERRNKSLFSSGFKGFSISSRTIPIISRSCLHQCVSLRYFLVDNDNRFLQCLDVLQSYFDQTLICAWQDRAEQFSAAQSQLLLLRGDVQELR